MKDITIKGKSIRRELWILLGCFAFAVCMNIFAIIKYPRPAKELATMIGYVFVVTIITYITLCAIRLLDQFVEQPIVPSVVSCHGRRSSITKLQFLQKPREGGRTVEP